MTPTYAVFASAAKHAHSSGIRYRQLAKEYPERAWEYVEVAEQKINAGWDHLQAAREMKERFK